MRSLSKVGACMLAALLCLFLVVRPVLSHCEIPCGIYGDKMRIDMLLEHVTTIEKSMDQIAALQKESPINYNQLVRWTMNKEDHARQMQEIVMQYFMTQRVKPTPKGASGHEKYLTQITSLHGMLIQAMKTKQTIDTEHCDNLRALIRDFAAAYFNPEDLKHLREHHDELGGNQK